MTDAKVMAVLDRVESSVVTITELTGLSVTAVRCSIQDNLVRLKEETSVRVSLSEAAVIRSAATVALDADFHLLRAYFHASPSLIAIILAIYGFIQGVIEAINVINSILQVITGQTLAYWLDKMLPGFQSAWEGLMNKISEFSAILGWGVDGVHHLLNVVNSGADVWGMVTGKGRDAVKIEKYKRADKLLTNYVDKIYQWQAHPGERIAMMVEDFSLWKHDEGSGFINNLVAKLGGAADKVETVATGLGNITSEFLSLRNDMPAFIAKNIPAAIWDGIRYADTMINDRLLPRLDQMTDRINELDGLLDKYALKAGELAQKIARPGDLLNEIKSLPDYVRKDQEDKIDSVASGKLERDVNQTINDSKIDLSQFDKVYNALKAPLPSPEFMLIAAPGRAQPPGIVAEPRESWFAGDF